MGILITAIALATALAISGCGESEASPSERLPADVDDQLGFDQAGIIARQSRVEAAIRDCMKAEGFEYVPVDPFAQRAAILGSSRVSDEDFSSNSATASARSRGAAVPGWSPTAPAIGAGSRGSQAYDRALWGENAGATFTAAVDSGDFTKLGGCTSRRRRRSSAARSC